MENFEAFLYTTRQEAAKAYICQDSSLVDALFAKEGVTTLFDPLAGITQELINIKKINHTNASQVGLYGSIELDIKNHWTSGDLGFWSGLEKVEYEEGDQIIKLTHRVTEIYKNIGLEWKLIHRHVSEAHKAVYHPA